MEETFDDDLQGDDGDPPGTPKEEQKVVQVGEDRPQIQMHHLTSSTDLEASLPTTESSSDDSNEAT